MRTATRDQLIEAAGRQFAEKGFYGASIASIAEELGLTKQALLHHFGSKEKLYGEVLQGISTRLLGHMEDLQAPAGDPAGQLERVLLGFYEAAMADPEDSRLIMRELLDNKRRAERAEVWYLKPFLDALVDTVRRTEGRGRKSNAALLAIVYELLGAVSYFAVSGPTLSRMYGKEEYGRLCKRYPAELQRLIRARLQSRD